MRKMLKDRRGNAAIEYALISALIALSTLGTMQVLGHTLQLTFDQVALSFTSAVNTSPSNSTTSSSSDTSGGSSSTSGTSSSDPAPAPQPCHGKGKKACP